VSSAVVCWDFDETLGYFRPREYGWEGKPVPADLPPARLKPGISELLESLSEFTHVVTTAAVRDYAISVLQEFGLLRHFMMVLGREDGIYTGGEGKDYGVVGARCGYAEDTLKSRLVIVGNDDKADPDSRYRQVVMVHNKRMMDQPSAPLGVALRGLHREGEGDFKRGFDALFDRSAGKPLHFEDSVKLRLDYWGNYAENRVHPIVTVVN
jgi:hypothetical protein